MLHGSTFPDQSWHTSNANLVRHDGIVSDLFVLLWMDNQNVYLPYHFQLISKSQKSESKPKENVSQLISQNSISSAYITRMKQSCHK